MQIVYKRAINRKVDQWSSQNQMLSSNSKRTVQTGNNNLLAFSFSPVIISNAYTTS